MSSPGDLEGALAGLALEPSGPDGDWVKQQVMAGLFGEEIAPRTIGRFTVLRRIGRGGMGEVFSARDPELDRMVAIKVVARRSPTANERFLREGRALAKLAHGNIVQIHEVGEHHGSMYIAMEFVAGRTFAAYMSEGRAWREVIAVMLEAARGLSAAHAAGLVHRDFKPENVMIGDDGRVRVLDFGLARELEFTSSESDAQPGESAEGRVTETGSIVGTPAYMAPEQHHAWPATPAADQFSFCVSLWEALHGQRPFVGRTRKELLEAIERGTVVPVRAAIPSRIRRIVRRGLAADPLARWPSVAALEAALTRRIAPTPKWPLLGIPIAAAAIAFGLAQDSEPEARCAGAAERMVGVWDPDTRDRARAAVFATDQPYAAQTWAEIESRLDGHADAWITAHTETCEATRVYETQSEQVLDLRMACLERNRGEIDAAVRVITEIDAARLGSSVELLLELPDVERCANIDALQAEIAPPEDPKVADDVDALRVEWARVHARLQAGEIEIEAEAEEVVWAAERLRYEPMLAEALLLRGIRLELNADYAGAATAFERAFTLASELGHAWVQADAAHWLAWVVGHRQRQLDAGLAWGKSALAIATRPNSSKEDQAKAATVLAVIEQARGDLDGADDHMNLALRLREDEYGPDDLRVGISAGNLARLQHGLQRRPESREFEPPRLEISKPLYTYELLHHNRNTKAVGLLRRAITLIEKHLGPDHPRLILELRTLGLILRELGENEAGHAANLRAVDIAERTVGCEHPDYAMALIELGRDAHLAGDIELALGHFQRAGAVLDAALGVDDPNTADAQVHLCMVLVELARPADAVAHCERAWQLRAASYGPEHLVTASAEVLFGTALRRAGRLDEAIPHLLSAREGLIVGLGGANVAVVLPLTELAEAALEQDQVSLAIDYADLAVSTAKSGERLGGWPGRARFVFARALARDPARRKLARSEAELARHEFLESGAPREELERVEAWLADSSAPE